MHWRADVFSLTVWLSVSLALFQYKCLMVSSFMSPVSAVVVTILNSSRITTIRPLVDGWLAGSICVNVGPYGVWAISSNAHSLTHIHTHTQTYASPESQYLRMLDRECWEKLDELQLGLSSSRSPANTTTPLEHAWTPTEAWFPALIAQMSMRVELADCWRKPLSQPIIVDMMNLMDASWCESMPQARANSKYRIIMLCTYVYLHTDIYIYIYLL